MLELFLGQIPEAIFFALFMIYAKGLKEKRTLFTGLMIAEYLLLINVFKYNWFFHIGFIFMTFLTLKILYKEKAQITDIFTFGIASIIMMIICGILYFIVWNTINDFTIYAILTRIFMFAFLFLFKNKLRLIQDIYKKLWNRNDKENTKIKSTTFRSFNIVIFNLMFYIINICMLYTLVIGRGA